MAVASVCPRHSELPFKQFLGVFLEMHWRHLVSSRECWAVSENRVPPPRCPDDTGAPNPGHSWNMGLIFYVLLQVQPRRPLVLNQPGCKAPTASHGIWELAYSYVALVSFILSILVERESEGPSSELSKWVCFLFLHPCEDWHIHPVSVGQWIHCMPSNTPIKPPWHQCARENDLRIWLSACVSCPSCALPVWKTVFHQTH